MDCASPEGEMGFLPFSLWLSWRTETQRQLAEEGVKEGLWSQGQTALPASSCSCLTPSSALTFSPHLFPAHSPLSLPSFLPPPP